MSKKIFTLLLLAVFVLAQFSMASAAAIDGSATISVDSPWGNDTFVSLNWEATGLTGIVLPQYVMVWAREKNVPPALPAAYVAADCQQIADISSSGDASGVFDYDVVLSTLALVDGDTIEFAVTLGSTSCDPLFPPATTTVNASAYVDANELKGFIANPPYDGAAAFGSQPVACNTFEMWALASDNWGFAPNATYSGIGGWRQRITGTFAPPAPEGDANALLSWVTTIPGTASGAWSFAVTPFDAAFNFQTTQNFRAALAINGNPVSGERVDCVDFSDTAGHANEAYIRYLADLGLISGFSDGTFGPDSTLTRAEAATLIEISNGYVVASLPTAAPSAACSFSDVAPTDWFAGWVWQACADGYMNGIGGGLFDPNNTLTRGQIVTILNNVNTTGGTGGYLNNAAALINAYWDTNTVLIPGPILSGVFTDVYVGAYYATPVSRAYGWGVADATSATTFSPDVAVTRGDFSKMLYRALSITQALP